MLQKSPRVACLIGLKKKKKEVVVLKDKGWNSFDPIVVWSTGVRQLKNRDISEQNIMSLAVLVKNHYILFI